MRARGRRFVDVTILAILISPEDGSRRSCVMGADLSGDLKDLRRYPHWLQSIVRGCEPAKRAVAEHDLYCLMRDGLLPERALHRFLTGVWPVIEQFPQYMAMNLVKVQLGCAGHDL